jgi:hypothetical protein
MIMFWARLCQPDLFNGGHAGLPSGGQCDYLVWLRSVVEARA